MAIEKNLLLNLLLFTALGCSSAPSKDADGASTFCDRGVCISKIQEGKVIRFVAQTSYDEDITLSVRMEYSNAQPSVRFSRSQITRDLHNKEKLELFTLSPTNPDLPMEHRFHFWWKWGKISARHDDSFIYRLPFQAGASVKISQGFDGQFSHFGEDEFATDFPVPLGTTICSARDGKVIDIKDDSAVGGPDNSFGKFTNFIKILHSDGTIGVYFHLLVHGVFVKRGDVVKMGQPIALSGNTGFSSEPHLHFEVQRPVDGRVKESLPILFKAKESPSFVPKFEQIVTAIN